jgi:spermidine/putrescine transport system substrate-binding protein
MYCIGAIFICHSFYLFFSCQIKYSRYVIIRFAQGAFMKENISLGELQSLSIESKTSRRNLLSLLGAGAISLTFDNDAFAKAVKKSKPIAKKPALKFYNWDTYIGKTTLKDFALASNIPVDMKLYESNEELLANMRKGNSYDVIVPSNNYVATMIEEGLLQKLDTSLIPNAKNISFMYRSNNYDKGLAYSMPYTWLVTGIGYRKSAMGANIPNSWASVFANPTNANKIRILNEDLDIYCLAALYLGIDPENVSDANLSKIMNLLQTQAKNGWLKHDDDGQDMLLKKEADIVVEYNGDIAQVNLEDKDIDFIVPKEGALISCDCLCIPKTSKNAKSAHKFINFLLDGVNGAKIANEIKYPTPNSAALGLMNAAYRDNKIIYPDAALMSKCIYFPRFSAGDLAKIKNAFSSLNTIIPK